MSLSEKMQKEISEIAKAYRPDGMFRALIYGISGSGKTYSLRTARRPVHLDSFDPNGSQSIDDVVYTAENPKGYIYVDTRFEIEDPKRPTAWKLFDKEIHRRYSEGYFNNIAMYATDLTSLSQAAMNQTLAESNRHGGVPQQNDYLPAMTKIINAIRFMMSFPCDVALLAHVAAREDAVTNKSSYFPLTLGKAHIVHIPLLFSEIYVSQTKETADGLKYAWLTAAAGSYTARTRLGKGGVFDRYEEPNFKNLLKKAGKSIEDKSY